MRSFDDLVGAGEDRRRDGEAERLGGVEIDDELEYGRLLDRQIGRLGALEHPSRVNPDLAPKARLARPIADQAAEFGELAPLVDRRNGKPCRQRDELFAPAVEEWIGADEERAGLQLDEGGEGGVDSRFRCRPSG
jgi:hypothetical protein